MKNVTSLVTGGTGFIGKRLVQCLLKNGIGIRLLSRSQKNEDTIICDLQTENIPKNIFVGIDQVFHLAARAHMVADHSERPIEEFRKINTDATYRLAMEAAKNGVKRFVYLSSIGVLGSSTTNDCHFDNKSPYNPKGPYAISKMEAEICLKKISDSTEMEIVIVRPPLVYGSAAPGNFHRLLKLVDSGIPLPLGGLDSKKSMISLDNLCNLLMKTAKTSLPKYSQLVVSDGFDWSTAELIRLIAKYMGIKSSLFSVPFSVLIAFASLIGKKEEIRKLAVPLRVNGSETARILNWYPIQSPENGVKEAVEYFLAEKKGK
jgi:nucleoside-diphosphate-sugar epimerase